MKSKTIIVVGAGIGGLTAALELSRNGHAVKVLEAGDRVGGKLRQIHFDGHPGIDCGPTVFTMRWVFDQMFDDLKIDLDEHLQLEPLELIARHAWCDGSRLDLFRDLDRTAEAIAAFAGRDEARRYLGFCQAAKKTFETLDKTYMQDSRPNVAQLMFRIAKSGSGGVASIHPFRSLWQELSSHFHDQRLRQLFGRYATYCGSSPFLAPGTLMLIAHVEQMGVFAIRGGMVRIAEVFANLIEGFGGAITCGTQVREVIRRGGRVCGVVTQHGEALEADAVIFNGDVNALATGEVGCGVTRMKAAVTKRTERSQSAITFALVGTSEGFDLAEHTVCFSDDYAAEFDDVFKRGHVPHKPTVYINAPDCGGHGLVGADAVKRLFVLINAPADGDVAAYDEAVRQRARQAAWRTLARCGLDVREVEGGPEAVVTTPNEFARRFPATGGALYGRASHGWQASFARQGARSAVPGLYLAGGSVHPGAGVPMALLSGRLAARAVREDLAKGNRR